MFRSISDKIEKLKKNLSKFETENNSLNHAFSRFLNESFPEGKNLSFEVSIFNKIITIKTSSKIVANELIFKVSDLSRIFKEEKINSEQIVIR
ncbi:MAG: hypothetical protein WD989_02410 [Candidatus Paceibacterota bacterium]